MASRKVANTSLVQLAIFVDPGLRGGLRAAYTATRQKTLERHRTRAVSTYDESHPRVDSGSCSRDSISVSEFLAIDPEAAIGSSTSKGISESQGGVSTDRTRDAVTPTGGAISDEHDEYGKEVDMLDDKMGLQGGRIGDDGVDGVEVAGLAVLFSGTGTTAFRQPLPVTQGNDPQGMDVPISQHLAHSPQSATSLPDISPFSLPIHGATTTTTTTNTTTTPASRSRRPWLEPLALSLIPTTSLATGTGRRSSDPVRGTNAQPVAELGVAVEKMYAEAQALL